MGQPHAGTVPTVSLYAGKGIAEGHRALRGGCGVEEGSPTGRADDALLGYFINAAINTHGEVIPSILLGVLCHPQPTPNAHPLHPKASPGICTGLWWQRAALPHSYTLTVPSKWPGELLRSLTAEPHPSLIAPD